MNNKDSILYRILCNFGNPKGKFGKFIIKVMNTGHKRLHKWGITLMDIKEHCCILDIGCGGASCIKMLSERYKTCKIYGIDHSEESINGGSILSKKHLNKQVYLLKADIMKTPFEDNFFDIIMSYESIYFWQDLNKAFQEIDRIAKNGCKIYIFMEVVKKTDTFWSGIIPNMKEYSYEEIMQVMEDNGFINISYLHKPFGRNAVICEKVSL